MPCGSGPLNGCPQSTAPRVPFGCPPAPSRLHHEELEGCWWEEEAALHWKDKGSSDGGSGSGAAAVAAAAAAAAAPGAAGAGAAAAEAPPGTDDWAYFMGGCAGEGTSGRLVLQLSCGDDMAARLQR